MNNLKHEDLNREHNANFPGEIPMVFA